jgi:aspartate-semialdehyde dehydrogenase
VPEVNADDALKHSGIIANPNCSTIQMVLVLAPLNSEFVIRRVVVSTYQSVSGTGKEAVDELRRQVEDLAAGRAVTCEVYPHQIAYNCLPHIDVFLDNGYTGEEMKMVNETRKIMGAPGLAITATTVRVPVFVGHSEERLPARGRLRRKRPFLRGSDTDGRERGERVEHVDCK